MEGRNVCACNKRRMTAPEMVAKLVAMVADNARTGYRREPHGYLCPTGGAYHVTGDPISGRPAYRIRGGKIEKTFGL